MTVSVFVSVRYMSRLIKNIIIRVSGIFERRFLFLRFKISQTRGDNYQKLVRMDLWAQTAIADYTSWLFTTLTPTMGQL